MPTGAWGRPPRLHPRFDADRDVVDLRDSAPAEWDASFRPTPPPPLPPGAGVPSGPAAGRIARGRRAAGRLSAHRRAGLEVAGAVLLLALLAGMARPHPAAPSPAGAWAGRAAPAVDALARDLATAETAGWSAATGPRLQHDEEVAERVGPPPDRARAGLWARVIGHVRSALAVAGRDPAEARSEVGQAALEIVGLASAQTPSA